MLLVASGSDEADTHVPSGASRGRHSDTLAQEDDIVAPGTDTSRFASDSAGSRSDGRREKGDCYASGVDAGAGGAAGVLGFGAAAFFAVFLAGAAVALRLDACALRTTRSFFFVCALRRFIFCELRRSNFPMGLLEGARESAIAPAASSRVETAFAPVPSHARPAAL